MQQHGKGSTMATESSGSSQAQMQSRSARPRGWPRWTLTLGLSVAFLMLLVGGWHMIGWHYHVKLQAVLDGYRRDGQPVLPADFRNPPAAAGDNAADAILQAARQLKLTRKQLHIVQWSNTQWLDVEPAEVSALMSANQPVLDLLHQARSMKGCDWGPRVWDLDSEQEHQDFVQLNVALEAMQRLLFASMYWHSQQGRSDLAVEALHDQLALTKSISRCPHIIFSDSRTDPWWTRRVEVAFPSLDLSSQEAQAAAKGLIVDLLDESAVREAADRHLLLLRAQVIITGRTRRPWTPPMASGHIRMVEFITAAAQGLREGNLQLARAVPLPPVRSDGPRWWAGGAARGAVDDLFRSLANRRMLATALAIKLFEADTGRSVQRLEELVPTYLPQVPRDPYALSGSVRLRVGERPAILTVGEDGEEGRHDDREFALNGSHLEEKLEPFEESAAKAIEDAGVTLPADW